MSVWWKSFLDRLPVYIFPAFLVVIEWILRSISSLDTQTFIGPTLAAVGASYLVPLTIDKPLTQEKQKKFPQVIIDEFEMLRGKGISVRTESEQHFIQFCWVCVLVFTGTWALSLYLSAKFPHNLLWIAPASYYPGIVNYFGGIVLCEIREGVL